MIKIDISNGMYPRCIRFNDISYGYCGDKTAKLKFEPRNRCTFVKYFQYISDGPDRICLIYSPKRFKGRIIRYGAYIRGMPKDSMWSISQEEFQTKDPQEAYWELTFVWNHSLKIKEFSRIIRSE